MFATTTNRLEAHCHLVGFSDGEKGRPAFLPSLWGHRDYASRQLDMVYIDAYTAGAVQAGRLEEVAA